MYYSVFDVFSTGIWIFLVLLYALICGGFSCWLASIKGYGMGAWFGLGFLFGVFALFAIGVAPIRKTETKIISESEKDEFSMPNPIKINVETIEPGIMLNVSKSTTLREGSGISTKFIKNLVMNTKVKFIRTGESTKEDGITVPWLFVETEEGEQGYCFSHDLEENKVQ
jgi:hypothetical protein